jgi:hypothetical protein
MFHSLRCQVPAVLLVLMLVAPSGAHAQVVEPQPSPYGPDDVIGALNEITPEKRRQAAALIQEGQVYDLQMVVEPGAPAFPPRYFQHSLIYNNVMTGVGSNDFRWSDELIAGYLGTFTQVDCLGHPGIGKIFYGGRHWEEIATPHGLSTLGCEELPPTLTRGLLLDIAGLKGVELLPDNYEITPADMEAAMARQGIEGIEPGDIVVLHTGWMSVYHSDPNRWISSEPGIGIPAAEWLAARRPAAVGADTWGIDYFPTTDDSFFPAHQILMTNAGILMLENLVTEELVRDEVWEFAFSMTYLKVRGAGQTWGTFTAMR